MTTFFEHQKSSFKRNYLKNLIALAYSDGELEQEERSLIIRIGLKRGLKDWQINELLDGPIDTTVFIPESMNNRMNMLYDLMQIMYADNSLNQKESEFLTQIVHAFRLDPCLVEELIRLFESGKPTTSEWVDFLEHRIYPHTDVNIVL